ncbi:protein-L-isoaspartate O-methyltransferase family protein [Parerythrobacter aestuarii]|uniref:protein-L-isoaspartate O-methyltransferase family protein n=1 Tax=Parerythrobacter aestuarii TaxID=3020909 RepID=UPI0024DE4C2D|nr:protein-L-isoaspartate O-methyltransferase [Parerythrobacter aestuarii]
MIDTATRPLDFAAARRAMLDSQLRTSGVNAPFVLERMGAVAREDFVPADAKGYCYMDRAIALPDGGTLAQPVSHGKMLAEARPEAGETVLVVDNSNGYLATLVAPLAARVDTVSVADALSGKKRGSYDLILVDGAIEECPTALTKRLADTGRLVTGLFGNGVARLATGRKVGKDIAFKTVEDVALPRLSAFDKPKGWSF